MRYAQLLPIALAGFALSCGETPAPADYPDAIAADPDHYSVEFENDAVRVVRIEYGAGEESVMHEHPASCAVALSDASWQMTLPDGEVAENEATLGEIDCTIAGAHIPKNTGTEAAELILVEFHEGATAGTATAEYPDAVTADPDHYTVEWENDVARMVRIRYGPGETSVMHYHPANCAVFLAAERATFELPSGEVVEPPAYVLGQLECFDAQVHRPTNLSEEPLEVVLLGLKGRATLE